MILHLPAVSRPNHFHPQVGHVLGGYRLAQHQVPVLCPLLPGMSELPQPLAASHQPHAAILLLAVTERHPGRDQLVLRAEVSVGRVLVPAETLRAARGLDSEVRAPDEDIAGLQYTQLLHQHGDKPLGAAETIEPTMWSLQTRLPPIPLDWRI